MANDKHLVEAVLTVKLKYSDGSKKEFTFKGEDADVLIDYGSTSDVDPEDLLVCQRVPTGDATCYATVYHRKKLDGE